jgi:hypothetical protein
MRKIILVVIIAGFALALPLNSRPYLYGWLQMTASSESAVLENIISLEPVEQLSIMQGKSGQALIMANKTDAPVKFNLGHAHGYLAIDPQSEILQSEATRFITLHVDDFCPSGENRGGHAHKELRQLIVAASGSFNVLLDDSTNKNIIMLNRPDYGLMIVPGIWRELMEFYLELYVWC